MRTSRFCWGRRIAPRRSFHRWPPPRQPSTNTCRLQIHNPQHCPVGQSRVGQYDALPPTLPVAHAEGGHQVNIGTSAHKSRPVPDGERRHEHHPRPTISHSPAGYFAATLERFAAARSRPGGLHAEHEAHQRHQPLDHARRLVTAD